MGLRITNIGKDAKPDQKSGIVSVDDALAPAKPAVCNWVQVQDPAGGWATRCNLMYIFQKLPKEMNYSFCPNCGRVINYLDGIYPNRPKKAENNQAGHQA